MGAKTSKRLAILVAVIGILGGAAYFTRQFQVSRMAHSMVAQAEQAEQTGDYVKAVELYLQHLGVVPDDNDVKIKYADALLKVADTPINQNEAMAIYAGVLNTQPHLDDIRARWRSSQSGSDEGSATTK